MVGGVYNINNHGINIFLSESRLEEICKGAVTLPGISEDGSSIENSDIQLVLNDEAAYGPGLRVDLQSARNNIIIRDWIYKILKDKREFSMRYEEDKKIFFKVVNDYKKPAGKSSRD